MDLSPISIGLVLDQEGLSVLCIFRRLNPTTRNETLAHRAFTQLRSYLFDAGFTLLSDQIALKIIYDPTPLWFTGGILPSVPGCIVSRIQMLSIECSLRQPLPIRIVLIHDTCKYFGTTIPGLLREGTSYEKHRLLAFLSYLKNPSANLLCFNDRT